MDRIELYVLDLRDRLREPVERYLSCFDEERRASILRRRSMGDRARTVWTELLARWAIERRTGMCAAEIDIARDAQGKPYVLEAGGQGEARRSSLEISLSHSGPWAACSLGAAPSGVDVETDRRATLDIARRFFSEEEHLSLKAQWDRDPEEGRRALLRHWTLKEGYAKCTGTPLAVALKIADRRSLLSCEGDVGGRELELPGGAVLAVCSAPALLPEALSWASPEDIEARLALR